MISSQAEESYVDTQEISSHTPFWGEDVTRITQTGQGGEDVHWILQRVLGWREEGFSSEKERAVRRRAEGHGEPGKGGALPQVVAAGRPGKQAAVKTGALSSVSRKGFI